MRWIRPLLSLILAFWVVVKGPSSPQEDEDSHSSKHAKGGENRNTARSNMERGGHLGADWCQPGLPHISAYGSRWCNRGIYW